MNLILEAKKIMKKCIMHIGMHKTGSSAIQEYLYKNSDLGRGVVYADLGESNHSGPVSFAFKEGIRTQPFFTRRGLTEEVFEHRKIKYRKMIEKELSKNYSTIIFSAEAFVTLSVNDLLEFRELLARYVDDIEIVAYVRKPISFAESAFQQKLKYSATEPTVEQIFPSYIHQFKKFDEIFDNLNYRLYERSNLIGTDVVRDFIHYIPLERSISVGNINVSISQLAVKFLYRFNKAKKSMKIDFIQSDEVIEILARIEGKKFLLDEITIQRAYQKNELHNTWMARQLGLSTDEFLKYDKSLRPEDLESFYLFSQEEIGVIHSLENFDSLNDICINVCDVDINELLK
jgi:hypothetical protein